jgi:hypothetical protein
MILVRTNHRFLMVGRHKQMLHHLDLVLRALGRCELTLVDIRVLPLSAYKDVHDDSNRPSVLH